MSNNWKEEYNEMPEFKHENREPFKKLIINFKTENDYLKFQELLGKELTIKTKSIYFPLVMKNNLKNSYWGCNE